MALTMTLKRSFSYALTAIIAGFAGYMIRPNSVPVKDCNNVVMNYSNTPANDTINGSILQLMAGRYRNMRPQGSSQIANSYTDDPINKTQGLEDATSVWFGLEDLKRFIWEIESKVCAWQDSCPQTPALNLGIRIYYARYHIPTGKYGSNSNNKYFADLRDEYENMHTVFMIPTFDAKSKKGAFSTSHKDFYLNRGLGSNCLPQQIVTVADRLLNAPVRALLPDGKNHGDLCPPICSAGDAAFAQ